MWLWNAYISEIEIDGYIYDWYGIPDQKVAEKLATGKTIMFGFLFMRSTNGSIIKNITIELKEEYGQKTE